MVVVLIKEKKKKKAMFPNITALTQSREARPVNDILGRAEKATIDAGIHDPNQQQVSNTDAELPDTGYFTKKYAPSQRNLVYDPTWVENPRAEPLQMWMLLFTHDSLARKHLQSKEYSLAPTKVVVTHMLQNVERSQLSTVECVGASMTEVPEASLGRNAITPITLLLEGHCLVRNPSAEPLKAMDSVVWDWPATTQMPKVPVIRRYKDPEAIIQSFAVAFANTKSRSANNGDVYDVIDTALDASCDALGITRIVSATNRTHPHVKLTGGAVTNVDRAAVILEEMSRMQRLYASRRIGRVLVPVPKGCFVPLHLKVVH